MSAVDYELATSLGSATIHEAAGRTGALRADLLPANHPWSAAGPAFTVNCPCGDNLWLHRAIYEAAPGDVLVVATGDVVPRWGYWGEILSVAARERRLGALVLEGGSRDHGELARVGFPVWSIGRCVRGTIKDDGREGGSLREPIQIGDVTISHGDLVVADFDGVVVVEAARAATVVRAGEDRRTKEAGVMAQLAEGRSTLELFDLP